MEDDGRTGRNLELLTVLMYDDTIIIYNLIILLPRSSTASPLMHGTQLLSFLGQRSLFLWRVKRGQGPSPTSGQDGCLSGPCKGCSRVMLVTFDNVVSTSERAWLGKDWLLGCFRMFFGTIFNSGIATLIFAQPWWLDQNRLPSSSVGTVGNALFMKA